MTKKSFFVYAILFISINTIHTQPEDQCKENLSIFHELVKAKNYDAAYGPWSFVEINCPKLNIATYVDGEKILKHKINSSKDVDKSKFIDDLLMLWGKRIQYFPKETERGEYLAKACQLKYDNKELLGENISALYDCFDDAFNADKKTFNHPKNLYTYFSLAVDLYDSGKKTSSDLFNKYDDIDEKIGDEIQNYSKKLNILLEKTDKGIPLTKVEQNKKEAYQSYLKNYDLISQNIYFKHGKSSNCENLIPLYSKDFNAKQNDSIWLKRAVSRMYHKECAEDPLYEKLVKKYDEISPSADTKIYVVTVLIKNGKTSEINKYLNEAYDLETDDYKKANLAYRIGIILKKKGQYNQARMYFRNSLKLNPSNGKPYLAIASMYSDSANVCGEDNFHKRAVYWLAAKEAKKAPIADPTLLEATAQYVADYESKAPNKQDIFIKGMEGKTINIGCWINSSIIVPKL